MKIMFSALVAVSVFCCSAESKESDKTFEYDALKGEIVIDGEVDDWRGLRSVDAQGKDHLWTNTDMPVEKWQGNQDLSFFWRAAWSTDKLFFLIEVRDDRFVEPTRDITFHNDCVEIFLDHKHRKGPRLRKGETLGYEIHFVPGDIPKVYFHGYRLSKPHTEQFQTRWDGEVAFQKTKTGYRMELGFKIPEITLEKGRTLGLDVAVCDDDGSGRESQMTWTGTKGKFWSSMDDYGTLVIK